METKICKICERELPISSFRTTKSGSKTSTCTECITAKRRENKAKNQLMGGKTPPFSDPSFDDLPPREVIELMSRAKKWLESRGFSIRLEGEYTKTTVYKLKF